MIKKQVCSFDCCSKKLKIIDISIKCKCGNSYCERHRHPENHNCTYDYKKDEPNKVDEMRCIFRKLVDKI
tara:strand:- start:197 stop:406 length:210 start_codon:yes stop_codon:yes gene_type:complete